MCARVRVINVVCVCMCEKVQAPINIEQSSSETRDEARTEVLLTASTQPEQASKQRAKPALLLFCTDVLGELRFWLCSLNVYLYSKYLFHDYV